MTAVFTWDLATDEVAWSDAMYRLLGYEPGAVRPTVRLALEHKHPADRARARQLIRAARTELQPFVFRHRIVRTDDETRSVVLAAAATRLDRGRATEISGTTIDLTDSVLGPSYEPGEREADELRKHLVHLEQALTSRDVIGQAKGILMHTYAIDADAAFDLLRLASQRAQRKLYDVASEVSRSGRLDVD